MTTEIVPIPERALVLGEVDGITYIQMPDGHVWMRAWKNWRFFCTSSQWPYTATARALWIQSRPGNSSSNATMLYERHL